MSDVKMSDVFYSKKPRMFKCPCNRELFVSNDAIQNKGNQTSGIFFDTVVCSLGIIVVSLTCTFISVRIIGSLRNFPGKFRIFLNAEALKLNIYRMPDVVMSDFLYQALYYSNLKIFHLEKALKILAEF